MAGVQKCIPAIVFLHNKKSIENGRNLNEKFDKVFKKL